MDFLAENNSCGQTILALVSGANAIIAELLRLSDYIPNEFYLRSKQDQQKYGEILNDFSYFRTQEASDQRIEHNPELLELDEAFKENHLEILTRFYFLFESIHKYKRIEGKTAEPKNSRPVTDLNRFLDDLKAGVFIQQTLESVIVNEDGKQLMCEALYLYGIMLLTIDRRIEGAVRERMLVSYYRYSARNTASESSFDDICKLLRGTAFTLSARRPANYPEEFFARVPIDSVFISMVIGRLRSDDLYNLTAAYPLPEHRSVALSTQSAMLYVCLYFAPTILHQEQSTMREVVDKFFPDNWVISTYMGEIVSLPEQWAPYRAASSALNNTLDPDNIRLHGRRQAESLHSLQRQLDQLLKEGVLVEEYVLDHFAELLTCLRQANVTLRWLILHSTKLSPLAERDKRLVRIRDQVIAESRYTPKGVFDLLLQVSQFEYRLREMFRVLLDGKQANWERHKLESFESMQELSAVFSGTKPLTRVEKNANLVKWFETMGTEINALNIEDSTASGRKIVQIIQALEEVQEFHQLEQNMQVKQFLAETRQNLYQMLRTINVKEQALVSMQIVGDLSYAWQIIDDFTPIMQQRIKEKPSVVIAIRAAFLKLASALDLPLMRINQAQSSDLESVSQYYSSELVNYVRNVLQIIPKTMFTLLAEIVDLLTNRMQELPTRLEKERLKEFAQLDQRYQVAKLTHAISVFTEGILQMKTTLVGIIEVDPKQLLEDGIRKELIQQVAKALHSGLIFDGVLPHSGTGAPARPKPGLVGTSEVLVAKLEQVGFQMDGFRRSFEYIQDYVNIYGLKIWQQELSRIMFYNVEQECNSFLREKISDWESSYQSKAIPIPKFPRVPASDLSVNFIGRLAREILRITDPRATIFLESMCSWYDVKTKQQLVGLELFQKLEKAVDSFGIVGLDRLFSFMIVAQLQQHNKFIDTLVRRNAELNRLLEELQSTIVRQNSLITSAAMDGSLSSSSSTSRTSSLQHSVSVALTRVSRIWGPFLDMTLRIGQLQLVRHFIAYQLRMQAKFDSKFLVSALRNFNQSVLLDVRQHYADPTRNPDFSEDDSNALLSELTSYLDSVGLSNCLDKIYVTTKGYSSLPMFMMLFVLSQLQKLSYSRQISQFLLVPKVKRDEQLDAVPFLWGCLTVFRQYHGELTSTFVGLLCTYAKVLIDSSCQKLAKVDSWPLEAVNILLFVRLLARDGHISRQVLQQHLPAAILVDVYRQASSATAAK